MRTLLILVLLAGSASARVIMVPAVPRTCPAAETWSAVSKCLAQFGKPTVVASLPNAKLVRVTSDVRLPGVYLYVQAKSWRIAGMYETASPDFELSKLTALTLAGHTGYRFDVRVSMRQDVAVSDEESRPALTQMKLAVFCRGDSYQCTQVVTSCDVFVDGRSRETYRGTLTFDGDTVKNAGDRRHATQMCRESEETPLFWR